MPWPFDREYMQLALVSGLVVGACAPMIGVFLVQKRMSLIGDGLGHLAFAGVAAGLVTGIWPYWTALVVAVAGAVVIERLRARRTASGDLALALMFYGGIAAGVVLVGAAGSLDASLFSFLFGSLLTVTSADMWTIVAIGGVIVATMAVAGRALFATVGDEEWARTVGVPVDALNVALAVLTAITIVAAMRVVGILLIAALMVLPVASGQLIARSFGRVLGWSVAIGTVSVVGGLAAARQWALAPGGTIVLGAALIFGILALVSGSRSAVTPPFRGWRRASGKPGSPGLD